ncbi:MAG: TlpA disulfide reductase family protein [Bacteroidota bacterium]|nr:TlpA disulfide reductase family protein [Bacteroidota bacterium]
MVFLLFGGMTACAAQSDRVVFKPDKPAVGKKIQVTYITSAAKAKLKGSVALEVLMLRKGRTPLLRKVPMTAKGTAWSATFIPETPEALALLCRFVSGTVVDDNEGNVWHLVLYEADRPLRDACFETALTMRNGGRRGFPLKRDLAEVESLLRQELHFWEDNWQARLALWRVRIERNPGQETLQNISDELEELYQNNKEYQEVTAALLKWFERLGFQDRAAAIRSEAIGSQPRGKVAETVWLAELEKEKDPFKRMGLIDGLLNEFSLSEQTRAKLEELLFELCLETRSYDRAMHLIELSRLPAPEKMLALSQSIFETSPELYDRAVEYGWRGIDFLRSPDPMQKPDDVSDEEWKRINEKRYASALCTLGKGMTRYGRADEAVLLLEEANKITKSEIPPISAALVEALLKTEKYQKAVQVAREAIRTGNENDTLVALYRTAYSGWKKTSEGFEKELETNRKAGSAAIRRKLKSEQLDIPAPAFTVQDLEGKTVTLAPGKGRALVLLFWSMHDDGSRKTMQAFVRLRNAFSGNDKARVFALESEWEEWGERRKESIRAFLKENEWKFPVLLDEGTAAAYGVTEFPETVVVGPDGRIRFRNEKIDDVGEYVRLVKLQVETLLEGKGG